MKILESNVVLVTIAAAISASAHQSGAGASHEAADIEFLRGYENVRAALASDNLGAAKNAAAAIKENENADALAKSASLADAREAFKKLSKRAVHVASDHEGYFIANCPMVKNGGGNWVQTTGKVSNPYFGKSMLTCGSIKPAKAEEMEKPAEHHHHD